VNQWFLVTKKRGVMSIEWRIPSVADLSSFIYWASSHGASYTIIEANQKHTVELRPLCGTVGEYNDGLLCPLASSPGLKCYPYRTNFRSTHKLLQHGLDGLPETFSNALLHDYHDEQIFLVSTTDGAFTLSPTEWVRLLSTAQEGPLYKLGIQIHRR
jgi:hypothetical protein